MFINAVLKAITPISNLKSAANWANIVRKKVRASFHFVVEEKKVLDRTEKRKEEKHISEYDTLL